MNTLKSTSERFDNAVTLIPNSMKPLNQILDYLTYKVSIHVPFLIFFGIGFVLAIYVLANG